MAQFGSVQNQYGIGPAKTPEVGMAATIVSWSDRHAATVIEVSPSGKRFTVQEDVARRTDSNGMSDAQSYEYERNPQGRTREFSLRKSGHAVEVGMPANDGVRCWLGVRAHYHDYSF